MEKVDASKVQNELCRKLVVFAATALQPFVDFLGNKERAGSTKKEVVKSRVQECEVGLQVSRFEGWVSRLTTYQRFFAIITAKEAQTTTQQQRSRQKTALRFTHQKSKQRDSHSYRHITIVSHDAPPHHHYPARNTVGTLPAAFKWRSERQNPDPSVAVRGPHILARLLVKAPSLSASANTCRPVALQVCRRGTNRGHLATVFNTSASVKDARRRWSGLATLFLLVSVKTAGVARCW